MPKFVAYEGFGLSMQESAVGVSAARSSAEVQAAYAALLELSIKYLQLLGSKLATSKRERKAHKAAEDAAYQLLDSLAKVAVVHQCTFDLLSGACRL